MKAVIQRVSNANVFINKNIKAEIKQGILLLLAIIDEDEMEDIDWMIKKISQMRIFNDKEGRMNLSILDIEGSILVISQFTLYASTKKGNRPSYIKAAKPEVAIPKYELFLKRIKELMPGKIHSGEFGADMKVTLLNDGPVTIILDSKNKV